MIIAATTRIIFTCRILSVHCIHSYNVAEMAFIASTAKLFAHIAPHLAPIWQVFERETHRTDMPEYEQEQEKTAANACAELLLHTGEQAHGRSVMVRAHKIIHYMKSHISSSNDP